MLKKVKVVSPYSLPSWLYVNGEGRTEAAWNEVTNGSKMELN